MASDKKVATEVSLVCGRSVGWHGGALLMVHCTFAGKDVILNFSVVKGDCPPLLSRPACTQLGIIFDCSIHTLSSRKLQVKQYGLTQTTSGHYIMCIEEFTDLSEKVRIPDDFRLSSGDEALVWSVDQNVLAAQISSSRPPRSSRTSLLDGIPCAEQALPGMRRHRAQDLQLGAMEMDGISEASFYRKGGVSAMGAATPKRAPRTSPKQSPGKASSAWMEVPDVKQEHKPEHYFMDQEDFQLTPKEIEAIKKQREKASRSAAKRIETKALTGIQADYPSLSHQWSYEVPFNLIGSVKW